MLLPSLGFLTAVAVFGLVGWALLSLRRRGEATPVNLALFVGGGISSALGAGWLYGVLVADQNHELKSRNAVLGLLPCLLVAGTAGGLCLVLVAVRRGRRGAKPPTGIET